MPFPVTDILLDHKMKRYIFYISFKKPNFEHYGTIIFLSFIFQRVEMQFMYEIHFFNIFQSLPLFLPLFKRKLIKDYDP